MVRTVLLAVDIPGEGDIVTEIPDEHIRLSVENHLWRTRHPALNNVKVRIVTEGQLRRDD